MALFVLRQLLGYLERGWLGDLEPYPNKAPVEVAETSFSPPDPQICFLRWVLTGLIRTKPPKSAVSNGSWLSYLKPDPQSCNLKWVLVG